VGMDARRRTHVHAPVAHSHREWFRRSVLADLLGERVACHDRWSASCISSVLETVTHRQRAQELGKPATGQAGMDSRLHGMDCRAEPAETLDALPATPRFFGQSKSSASSRKLGLGRFQVEFSPHRPILAYDKYVMREVGEFEL
jgi:hypothetical protein